MAIYRPIGEQSFKPCNEEKHVEDRKLDCLWDDFTTIMEEECEGNEPIHSYVDNILFVHEFDWKGEFLWFVDNPLFEV